MNVRRGKPVVTPISIPADQLEMLNKFLSDKNTLHTNKTKMIRNIAGGYCRCNEPKIPTKKVIYQLKGAQLVEWYCDECFNLKDFR